MAKPDFQHLHIGRRYIVVEAFNDYDGAVHPVGEAWTYLGHAFLPYEDGLTLSIDPGGSIRLQWRAEAQAAIIDSLDRYVTDE